MQVMGGGGGGGREWEREHESRNVANAGSIFCVSVDLKHLQCVT
jgi:hypothetical protein